MPGGIPDLFDRTDEQNATSGAMNGFIRGSFDATRARSVGELGHTTGAADLAGDAAAGLGSQLAELQDWYDEALRAGDEANARHYDEAIEALLAQARAARSPERPRDPETGQFIEAPDFGAGVHRHPPKPEPNPVQALVDAMTEVQRGGSTSFGLRRRTTTAAFDFGAARPFNS